MPDTIAWAVNDMVALLAHADMGDILLDFGKFKGREDPVVRMRKSPFEGRESSNSHYGRISRLVAPAVL